MSHLSKILSVGMGLSLLAGCGGDERAKFTSFRTPPTTMENFSRVNLIRIYSVGALTDYFTSIDFGVEKVDQGSSFECRILTPTNTEVASRSASPAHLYSNQTEDDIKNNSKQTDVEEAFFEGDNANRNGRNEGFEWTQIPQKQYLNFKQVWKISEQEYRFYVQFDTGGYRFDGNFRVVTYPTESGCETAAFLCTGVDGSGMCAAGDWPKRVESVTVHITAWRYPWGNYVRKLEATTFGGGETFQVGG